MTESMTVWRGADTRDDTPPDPVPFGTGRHLIHCPVSWDNCLDSPGVGEEHFVLADLLPHDHPLFNDGPVHFHDVQVVTESVREIGEFVGHRYFGVPAERPGLFYRYDLRLTDLGAWRAGPGGGSRLSTRLRAVPTHVVNGVPRGVDFHTEVSIDGTPCAVGSAGLVFLAPALYRNQLAFAQPLTDGTDGHRVDGHPVAPGGGTRRVPAAEVGRTAADNVLVSDPERLPSGRLCTWVRTDGVGAVFAGPGGRLPGLHLLEALRQSALLTAGRRHGLAVARCTLADSRVHFRGSAEAGPPLRCVAVPGEARPDTVGRARVPVTLTLSQGRKTVAEATAVVAQDL
ncbi:AfsA-related hotdog domain-containing protein [Streptomyces sp. NPDC051452]|uniref:AfsA-related hotdog domain-containing protein n=1 Tax=Streptomyces sp. NPDC051452 TaxID=3365654 RepID=UPI0037B74DF6